MARSMRKRIVFLGGGSYYFERVFGELAAVEGLDGVDVVLYDVDASRMDLMYRVGLNVARKARKDMTVRKSGQLGRALDGADFAIASIGVHGPGGRWHETDSNVAARFGIVHTTGDTVGPGGLSQGLRIIPIFINIARKMQTYCPGAVLLNHSNPMSPICRAVTKYTFIPTVGYCHNTVADKHYFARALNVAVDDLDMVAAGTNHCVWLLEITHKGCDVYPLLRRKLKAEQRHIFAKEMLDMFGLMPLGGDRHLVEFFPHSRRATKTTRIPYGLKWRSERIRAGRRQQAKAGRPLRDLDRKAAGKMEPWLPAPGQESPESMGKQIRAMSGGPKIVQFVNTPNHGAVPNLPDWAVLELKAVLGVGGARPIAVGELPPQAARWTVAQIYAHELMVDAAVEANREKAIQALACDPMIRDFKEAVKVFDALVAAQGDRLKKFRKPARRE